MESQYVASLEGEVRGGDRGFSNEGRRKAVRRHITKAKIIHPGGPWRGFEDVEYAMLEWAAWFNTQRVLAPLGYLPAAEYEAQYHRHRTAPTALVALN